MGWSRFANGEVKADDQRRAQSADQFQAHSPMDPSGVNTDKSSPIAHEMFEEIESGRTRFTQAYRLATRPSARHVHAPDSTDCGEAAMQKEIEMKDAAVGAHENTATSAGDVMDDPAELNRYYRKS